MVLSSIVHHAHGLHVVAVVVFVKAVGLQMLPEQAGRELSRRHADNTALAPRLLGVGGAEQSEGRSYSIHGVKASKRG